MIKKSLRVIIVLLIISVISCNFAVASSVYESPEIGLEATISSLNTPSELEAFLKSGFKYELRMYDKVQTPEETLRKKRGSCEDYAVLVSELLTNMNVKNEVYYITYKGINIRHAICVWKREDGKYSVSSNYRLHHTNQTSPKKAIVKIYPDCKRISKERSKNIRI